MSSAHSLLIVDAPTVTVVSDTPALLTVPWPIPSLPAATKLATPCSAAQSRARDAGSSPSLGTSSPPRLMLMICAPSGVLRSPSGPTTAHSMPAMIQESQP